MHKRDSERISANIPLRFPCCDTFNSGKATNLSGNGMYIDAEMCFPMKSSFEVLVELKDEILEIPVEIVRLSKKGNKYKGMGVALLSLPKKYLELLIKLKLGSQP
jgi:hypothetical protein